MEASTVPESPPIDFEKRKLGVSASEIAGVLGLSRYEDPFTIWAKKTGEVTDPPGGVLDIKRRMGRACESDLLQLYIEATGRQIIRPGTLAHPEREWQLASPDALVVDEARGVECKTAGFYQAHLWGDPENPAERDRVPTEYFLQCQWGMSVTRAEAWDLAAWIGSEFFGIYTLTPDPQLEAMMIEGALDFLDKYLRPGVAPPIGWTPASSAWIKEKYPTGTKDKIITATSEHLDLATRLYALKKIEKGFERISEGTINRVKAIMGENGMIAGAGWEIRWRKNKDSIRVDWEAAAKEMKTALGIIAEGAKALPAVIEEDGLGLGDLFEAAREAAGAVERHTSTVPGNRPFGKHWLPDPIFAPRLAKGGAIEMIASVMEGASPERIEAALDAEKRRIENE